LGGADWARGVRDAAGAAQRLTTASGKSALHAAANDAVRTALRVAAPDAALAQRDAATRVALEAEAARAAAEARATTAEQARATTSERARTPAAAASPPPLAPAVHDARGVITRRW
jgi:hypothetical protein